MKMKISTITPLHVGSGSEYGAQEFYKASASGKEVLVRADINKLFLMLPDELKDEFIIRLEEPQFKLQPFLQEVMSKLPKGSLGKIRIYFSYLESKFPDSIAEHVKTSHQAYIPGSSIKGSVKTALLHDMVGSGDIKRMKRLFRRSRRDDKAEIRRRGSQKFQDDFFSSNPKKAPSTSIMRFLQITDTKPVAKMAIHSINSVKAGKNGWTWYRHSEDAGKTFIESIGKGNQLEFEMNLNQKDEIIRKLGLDYKKEYLSLERILECIYRFSDDLIENEIDFAQKYRIDFLEDFYHEISSQNTAKSPIMNIGQGTGFLASTIGLKIREEDGGIYDKVREATKRRTYSDEFPKTRKVIMEEMVPMGWVKVDKI
ncbi:MAG: type III-A CRISPR-associated RAMP protein Csm5 [Methanobacteriales archaeon Met13]